MSQLQLEVAEDWRLVEVASGSSVEGKTVLATVQLNPAFQNRFIWFACSPWFRVTLTDNWTARADIIFKLHETEVGRIPIRAGNVSNGNSVSQPPWFPFQYEKSGGPPALVYGQENMAVNQQIKLTIPAWPIRIKASQAILVQDRLTMSTNTCTWLCGMRVQSSP